MKNIFKKNSLVIGLIIGVLLTFGVGAIAGGGKVINIAGDYIEAEGEQNLGGVVFEKEIFVGEVEMQDTLSVAGTATFAAASFSGDLTPAGDLTLTGDLSTSGIVTTGSGSYTATSTDAATYTFVAADLAESYLELQFTATDAISYTMPATSTMISILPEIGSYRTWNIHNASTTAVMTIVAGAGMDLVGIDANVDTIAAGGWAKMSCLQSVYVAATNENIMCSLEEYVDAD